MSFVEEDLSLAPWVGAASCKNVLSIIVTSLNIKIIENISLALEEAHAKGNHRWKLMIIKLPNFDEVVRLSSLTGRVAIDFVVLALDTRHIFCLAWAEKVLERIHPDLKRRRVVLVNASGTPMNAMVVNAGELISFQKENKVDIISSNVFIAEDAMFLAKRLLKHLEVTIGLKTGLPNFNI